ANTTSPTPTASLTVTPSPVRAGEKIKYQWSSSSNTTSWTWSLTILDSSGRVVTSDACGLVASGWAGPTGGNAEDSSWTGPTSTCMAGYTYYIYYKVMNGSQPAQAAAIVEVISPTATTQTGTNSDLAN